MHAGESCTCHDRAEDSLTSRGAMLPSQPEGEAAWLKCQLLATALLRSAALQSTSNPQPGTWLLASLRKCETLTFCVIGDCTPVFPDVSCRRDSGHSFAHPQWLRFVPALVRGIPYFPDLALRPRQSGGWSRVPKCTIQLRRFPPSLF